MGWPSGDVLGGSRKPRSASPRICQGRLGREPRFTHFWVLVSHVLDLGGDCCSLEALEVVCLPSGEVFVGDAGECVGVPQQRFGLGAPFVGECRAVAWKESRIVSRSRPSRVPVSIPDSSRQTPGRRFFQDLFLLTQNPNLPAQTLQTRRAPRSLAPLSVPVAHIRLGSPNLRIVCSEPPSVRTIPTRNFSGYGLLPLGTTEHSTQETIPSHTVSTKPGQPHISVHPHSAASSGSVAVGCSGTAAACLAGPGTALGWSAAVR